MLRTHITSYILSRLQQESELTTKQADTSNPKKTLARKVIFVQLINDESGSPQLSTPPSTLIPVQKARRRRSTGEEIDAAIASLDSERENLMKATNRAMHIMKLAKQSVELFQTSTKNSIKSIENPVRRRWAWAIDRVMLMNDVAKVTKKIEEWEKKQQEAKETNVESAKRGRTDSVEIY